MKKEYIIQYNGNECSIADVDIQIKELLSAHNIKTKDVTKVTTYLKVENGNLEKYAVVNTKGNDPQNFSF